MGCEKVILKNHKTSDSDVNSANKRLPLIVSDAGFGESDRVEIHRIASTQSSLGLKLKTGCMRDAAMTAVVPFRSCAIFAGDYVFRVTLP